MAERKAPLLVLTADVGNNSSIWLLWRGCQASEHFLFILAEGTAREMQDPPHAGPEAAMDDTACCELHTAPSYPRDSNFPTGHSSYGPKPGSVARGQGRAEHCRRGRSLRNSQTRPGAQTSQKEKGCRRGQDSHPWLVHQVPAAKNHGPITSLSFEMV